MMSKAFVLPGIYVDDKTNHLNRPCTCRAHLLSCSLAFIPTMQRIKSQSSLWPTQSVTTMPVAAEPILSLLGPLPSSPWHMQRYSITEGLTLAAMRSGQHVALKKLLAVRKLMMNGGRLAPSL